VDLAAYTTAASAADVDALRAALGYEQVNLLGVSYGTTLALAVLRDYPGIVRSAVLDSAAPPQVDWLEERAASFDRALSLNFEACVAQRQCQVDVATLRAAFERAVAHLNARPVTVPVQDPQGAARDFVVTGDRLVDLIHQWLYSPQTSAYIPALVEELGRGKETYLPPFVKQQFPAQPVFGITLGLYLSVVCGEQVSADSAAKAAAAARDVPPAIRGRGVVDRLVATCAGWPVGKVDGGSPRAVTSDRPALVLASANDPVTPPAYGQAAARTLPRSFYVETPGNGHGVIGSRCGWNLIARFFANPAAPPDAACAAGLGVPFAATPGP
jgi:pimeloyl-ACP methyl ester carboxylesterase